MDENTKKPAGGGRDISDLKARLGLKKGPTSTMPVANPSTTPTGVPTVAPPPAAMGFPQHTPTRVPVPPPTGIMPPPSSLPPPPGFARAMPEPEPPPTPQPPPPDPRRDPFAAQQPQMPPPGYYQPYAPIPGSDDGVPAQAMEKPRSYGRIAIIGGVVLVMFIAGQACGQIYSGRVNFNRTTDQAGDIRDEVDKMAKNLNAINDKVNASQNVAKGQPDIDLAADLGALDLKKPDTQKIFHTNYMYLEDLAIDRLFNYYNDSILLYDLIAKHAKKTEADKDSIKNYTSTAGGGHADKNFGVILDMSQAIPIAKFAEVGSPVCPKEGQTDCNANELKGFKYRLDSGGTWSQRPVKGKPTDTIIPIQQSPFFKAVASGSPDILAVKDHVRRMAEIRLLSAKLGQEQKELQQSLKAAAERAKVFTF